MPATPVRRSALRLAVLVLAAALGAALPAAHAGTLAVTGTVPPLNGMAPAGTVIEVTFDRAVTLGQFDADSFRVFGRGTGTASGTFTLVNANQTVRFTPTEPFSAGEIVYVNLKNDLVAADSSPIRGAGHAFQFTVAALPGAMDFVNLNTMSNRTGGPGGPQTRIYGAQATDLNHDGYLDLATVNEVSGDVRVALNTADGSGLYFPFLGPENVGLESSPNEQADFDNDGDTDGCFSAASDGEVWILKGNGDGTYGGSQTIDLGGAPHGIAVLDVDGDADWDIVDARVDGNDLALMLNDGNGTFGTPTFFDGGVGGEYGLQAADMNNDGIMDLVVAGRNSEEVRTLLGNGNGTFTPGAVQDSGGNTWVVAVGDLDGDGDLDVTTANDGDANGAVLFNDGSGDFSAPVLYGSDGHTPSTDLGDLDGDGDLDWILSVFGPPAKWIMYANDGSGVFTEVHEFAAPANPSCAVMLDFDNDGDVDLALTDEIADVVILHENVGIDTPAPTPACAPTPEPCRTPVVSRKAQLAIKNTAPDEKDRLQWKWAAGAATTKADFGNPVTTHGWDLCLYESGAFVGAQMIPHGGVCAGRPCWAEKTKSFDYKDKEYSPSGIEKVQLKEGVAGKASIQVKGRSGALGLPALSPPTGTLDVQLRRRDGGLCFGTTFSPPFAKDDGTSLKDKAD